MADVQKYKTHRRTATESFPEHSERTINQKDSRDLQKKFTFPHLSKLPMSRTLEICAKLDQLTNNGPIRQPKDYQRQSRANSRSGNNQASLISTARNSFREKSIKVDRRDKSYSNLRIEPTAADGIRSSGQSPGFSNTSGGFKINIWGGNSLISGHKKGASFDTLLR